MSWADVVAAINFWGPGGPSNVNGIPVIIGYPVAAATGQPGFSLQAQGAILAALQNLYNNSSTAQALLDAGAAAGQIWFFNLTGVTDQRGNLVDGTPNVTEMFGGPGAPGFAALAQYDVMALSSAA
jgi:hypothetical protein